MNAEYLPATSGCGPELVLLHGWGNNREIWRPLLARLRRWASVTLVDIPGLAPGVQPPASMDALLGELLAHCPPRALLVGWSLGGQLATGLAQAHPERFTALVTLASNPCFAARETWPGMAPETLAGFRAAAAETPAATLRRFDSLQASGALLPRQLLRQVSATRGAASAEPPQVGLEWLQKLDNRDTLARLQLPQLHLLAGADALVPASLAAALDQLLAPHAQAEVAVLEAASHLLPLERAADIAGHLQRCCQQWGLLETAPAAPPLLDKRDIAASFSRAATGYDSMAHLQRDVGEALLDHGGQGPNPVHDLLDLGSGTGYFCPALRRRYPGASYTGLDLAEGMAAYAREHCDPAARWLVADAEVLPLAAQSMDFVFSSLAIQWCMQPRALFAELARVLRPGGRCVFSTLGPGTLHELRSAWAAVDAHQHVNEFLPVEALEMAAAGLSGVRLRLQRRAFRMDYSSVRELLLELKTIGAHNVNQRRPAGLTSPAALRGMIAAYEDFRQDGCLPASYEVIFGELEKL